jgi:TPR repeat protein
MYDQDALRPATVRSGLSFERRRLFTRPLIRVIYSLRLVLLLGSLCPLLACSGGNDPVELFHSGKYDRAFTIFSDLAADGDLEACNYLGTHYYLGVGVERDFVEAVRWFKVAALAEDPQGQRNLGVMYLRGLGVKKDYHQAYGWLYFAHEGGNVGAKEYLNLMSDNVTPNASNVARRNVRRQIEARAAAMISPREKSPDS